MSFARRRRLLSAKTFGVPVWDVLHLVPPTSCRRVPRQALDASASESAVEGFGLFRALSDVNMRLLRPLRRGRASQRAGGVPSTMKGVLRPRKNVFPRGDCARVDPHVGGARFELAWKVGRPV